MSSFLTFQYLVSSISVSSYLSTGAVECGILTCGKVIDNEQLTIDNEGVRCAHKFEIYLTLVVNTLKILNHRRRRHHNCQLSIVNCQFNFL